MIKKRAISIKMIIAHKKRLKNYISPKKQLFYACFKPDRHGQTWLTFDCLGLLLVLWPLMS
jgi:hypothetical protein